MPVERVNETPLAEKEDLNMLIAQHQIDELTINQKKVYQRTRDRNSIIEGKQCCTYLH